MRKKEEKQVYIVISMIDKLNSLKNLDKNKLEEARINYESLNNEQRLLVSNVKVLEELEIKYSRNIGKTKNDAMIVGIVNKQLEASRELIFSPLFDLEIKERCLEYTDYLLNQISELQIEDLNPQVIINLRNEIEKLNRIERNKRMAMEVVSLIDDLPDVITLSSEEDVDIANSEYQSLDDEAKEYVNNYAKLERANEIIRDIKNAMVVINMINDLSTHVSLEDEEKIMHVNECYFALADKEKIYVTNYSKLEEINNALQELIQTAMDKKSAHAVDMQINILYDMVKDEDVLLETKHEQYDMVYGLYSSLTEYQKEYLEDEEKIIETKKIIDMLDFEAERKRHALQIYEEINALPYNIDVSLGELLLSLKGRYNNLDEPLKEYVTNIEVLNEAIKVYYDKSSAKKVMEVISLLDCEYSTDLVNEAITMYDSLNTNAKTYVINYDKLSIYVKNVKYNELLVEKALKLNIDIANMDVVCLDDEAQILLLDARYNSLSNNVKKYVSNIDILTNQKEKINNIKIADEMENKINILSNTITLKDVVIITELYEECEELSKDVIGYIDNYKKLTQAYKASQDLLEAVKVVEKEIKRIGEVELDEGDDIARVRMQYEILDEEMKPFVTNYEELLDMERKFLKLETSYKEEIKQNKINSYLDEQIALLEEIVNDKEVLTEKKELCIKMVRKTYDSLSDKSNVKNYNILLEIEKNIA